MARISTSAEGLRTIQFVALDGKRRSIRLGKLTKANSEKLKHRVECILASQAANMPLDRDTASWTNGISDELAAKLDRQLDEWHLG